MTKAPNEIDPKIRKQVADELGMYVYMLVHPETGIPFYVGKGQGQRFASHGREAMLGIEDDGRPVSDKIRTIQEIRDAGLDPEIWIVRYGMKSKAEYTAVEAACIDLLRSFPIKRKTKQEERIPECWKSQLTNLRREEAKGHGIRLFQNLYDEMAAPRLTTKIPLLLVTLGNWQDHPEGEKMAGGMTRYGYGYKNEWLTSSVRVKHYEEIGLSTSGWFTYSDEKVKNRGIKYVVAEHRGVTRALFKIDNNSWETDYEHPIINKNGDCTYRRAFQFEIVDSGPVFDETVGKHGFRVPDRKPGERNPIRYWPLKC